MRKLARQGAIPGTRAFQHCPKQLTLNPKSSPVGVHPGDESLPSLDGKDKGERDNGRSELHHREGVGTIELGDLAVPCRVRHDLLADDGTERETNVGHHGGHKLQHVEVELRSRGVCDTAHHRDEGGVDGRVLPLASEEAREEGSEGRLHRLEHVRKPLHFWMIHDEAYQHQHTPLIQSM